MQHFLQQFLTAFLFASLVIPASHTAGAVDPAVVIPPRAESSGSTDDGPAAAAGLRRAVVVPDLLGATAAGNGNRGDEVAVTTDVGEEVSIATDLDRKTSRPYDCYRYVTTNNVKLGNVKYWFYTADMCRSGPIRVDSGDGKWSTINKPQHGWKGWEGEWVYNFRKHGRYNYVDWKCGNDSELSEFGTARPNSVFVLYTWDGRICWYK